MSAFDDLDPISSQAHEDIEEKWRKDRIGNVTGSRIFDLVNRNKDGKYSSRRRDYLAEKVAERITGLAYETSGFITEPIRWGIEKEAEAVARYWHMHDYPVVPLGKVYIPHPTIYHAGCSPDALVGDNGGLEVKCPKTATHLTSLRRAMIPDEYIPQVLWCLACTGRQWWDFMTFDPRCPEHMQIMILRVNRSEQLSALRMLETEVTHFLAEVEDELTFWDGWRRP